MVVWGLGIVALLAIGALGTWVYVAHNVETPVYIVMERDGAIEIRAYPALLAAEVTRDGERDAAVRAGFRPLANYIFGKDRAAAGASIAMTAPVTQTRTGGQWAVRFLMPDGYTAETLPSPGGPDVRIVEVPAARVATIRFSGRWIDAPIAANEAALRAWLVARGHPAEGPATYAYYNDPFTPGFLRRNEVMIDLGPEQ